MKKMDKKMETLLLGLCTANGSFATPLKDLYKAFLLGKLRIFDQETGMQLSPSDYSDCSFESVCFGSQEKMGEYFMSRLEKHPDQESDTYKISHLLYRANLLLNELFEINRQLSETYGIPFSDGFLSLHNKPRELHIPHQDGSTKFHWCSRIGRMPNAQGTASPVGREELDTFCLRDVMDLL